MTGQAVPETLDLVRDFANASDLGSLAEPDRDRAAELQHAIRVLCLANNGSATDEGAAMGVLDAVSRRAGVGLRFDEPGGVRLVTTAGGGDGALGRVVAAVALAMAAGTWGRLKACRADDCLWVYYDATRNGSRIWCSMSECGNRAKARAYRVRRRGSL